MENKHFFYLIVTLSIFYNSCKENKSLQSNEDINTTEKLSSKKVYKIPESLKIEKQEKINIDDDETLEVIITAIDKNADYFYEYWFKNDLLIYKFTYPWGSINKKWLVNLDDDNEKEILRIQGYEDGVDYVIYDIAKDKQIPILYFNPVLVDKRYPNQYMWGYPNDIKSLIINKSGEVKVSFNNNYQRDDSHTEPNNQKELPFLFFDGLTSQPEAKIASINKSEFIPLQSIVSEVQKNSKTNHDLLQKGSIFKSWKNDNIEIDITTENLSYVFNGQCVYAFPIKILNDNEVELIWGEIAMDCVNDMQFNRSFGLSKEQIPQKGKPFAKYAQEKEVVKVTYYYEEWVSSYREQINEKPFMNLFYLKL